MCQLLSASINIFVTVISKLYPVHRLFFNALRKKSVGYQKIFLWKRRQYCLFRHGENKEDERAHSDGINDKLKNATFYFSNKQIICYIEPFYVCLRYYRTRLYWGYLKENLFESRLHTNVDTQLHTIRKTRCL